MTKKKKGKFTKESAMARLFANGIECREREVVAPTIIETVVDKMVGKKRIERTVILHKRPPGIKLWGTIDYLVKNHKFQIIYEGGR